MTVQIIQGDCRDVLRSMPDQSVQCVITSPPYFGVRDYQIAPSVWGGDPACEHEFATERVEAELRRGAGMAALGQRYRGGGIKAGKVERISAERGFCRCGAWRGCLGLEPKFSLYLEHMVDIARELRRVLRTDGVMWWNLGDSYAAGTAGERKTSQTGKHGYWQNPAISHRVSGRDLGLKPKDLIGAPWRVALALQADGWWLRRDIIYAKANPMPESVTDRPTTAHEYIFLLAKNAGSPLLWTHRDIGMEGRVYERPRPDYRWVHRTTREEVDHEQFGEDWTRINLWRGLDYYYDFEAIMEPSSPDSHARAARGRSDDHKFADGGPGGQTITRTPPSAGRVVGVGNKARPTKAVPNRAHGRIKNNTSFDDALRVPDIVAMRNKRSVWTVASEPFSGAHFATMPPALIEPCVLAGCPAGGTILDPFFGAGTTGLVADRLGRDCIGIDLNPDYVRMAQERIRADSPLFSSVEAAE